MRKDQNIFVKYHGATLEDDWSRVNRLAQICDSIDGVLTPKALWADKKKGVIAYERLVNPKPILDEVGSNGRIMRDLGRIIAKLHMREPVTGMYEVEPQTFSLSFSEIPESDASLLDNALPTGWFHSDCWHGNFLRMPDERVAVIDPLPDGYTVPHGYQLANGAIDLAIMHMSLFLCQPAIRHLYSDVTRYVEDGDKLLDGYLAEIDEDRVAVRHAILRLSRRFALNHVASYKTRLPMALAYVKTKIGNTIIADLDKKIAWRHS